MKKYQERVTDKILQNKLQSAGAVLIEGPKWCGKTATATAAAASVLYMQDPDYTNSYLQTANIKPSLLLEGDKPRLLDEWQMAPQLWDAVRFAVDKANEKGQFILTGSASPNDNVVAHTGTGRIVRLFMRTMSLLESQESNGTITLQNLFNNSEEEVVGISTLTIEKLAYALCRGGWPSAVVGNQKVALKQVYDYVDAIVNNDISTVDNIEKNPTRVRLLLRSLARNITTTANMSVLKQDIESSDMTLSEKTISGYINALKRIFVVEDLEAWSPKLRSKSMIRTSNKRHFVDPSIAIAAMRATPEKLLQDFETFGLLFESLCVRDLRIYAEAIDGEVFHYQDSTNLEADAIVQLRDGRWGAVEVKMGSSKIDEAAKNLLKLASKMDTDKMNPPSFLMVLTATEFAYRREDGVLVVPLGCLG